MRSVLWILALVLAGCPSTEEPEIVGVPVEAASVRTDTFDTDGGYAVTLQQGLVTVEDLHFHEPKDVETTARLLPHRWLLGPARAHAHPGHDMSGDVRGELTGAFVVDLLAEAIPLGEASFYEGPYETASLLLADDAASATAVLEGTADDGSGAVEFSFHVDHARTILGIPFETEVDAAAPPSVVLTVDPARILAHLDFAALDSDGDGTVTEADEGVLDPLLFGLESNLVYRYEVE